MNPTLQTLVNNAVTFTGLPLDQRKLALAYMYAKSTGSMPLDYTSLKALVQDFPGFSDDMYLNVLLYQLAKNVGYNQNNGPGVIATVLSGVAADGGIVDRETVFDIQQYAELRRLGAI